MNHTDNTAADERTLDDPLGEVLDVVGLNEYLGWYGGRPEDADKLQWKLTWNKPLIVSEFRGGAPYGRPGDADGRWTVEYQENLYQHQLGIVERMPNLAGMSPCVLMDFRSPLRMLPGVQDYHNRKGLISNRLAFKEENWPGFESSVRRNSLHDRVILTMSKFPSRLSLDRA